MYFDVVRGLCRGEDFGLVNVIDTQCFQDLAIKIVSPCLSLEEGGGVGKEQWNIPDTRRNDLSLPSP